ncbi:hypothetical protein HY989_02560 [Candidatus Micrarchaeota archaeon]|nr:hypothetical protein [Candidatus Micrarchaeota archaeon]
MKKQIKELVKLFPVEGMALHGTSYEKALRIKEDGLIEADYTPPVSAPLPHSRMQNGSRKLSEMFRRTIGSISLSAKYGGERGKTWSDASLTDGQLPAIVIFGRFDRPREIGYDSHYLISRPKAGLRTKHDTSFGKTPGPIKKEHVQEIVRITKKEQTEILTSVKSAQKQIDAMHGLLRKKTLHAIKELVEKKKP